MRANEFILGEDFGSYLRTCGGRETERFMEKFVLHDLFPCLSLSGSTGQSRKAWMPRSRDCVAIVILRPKPKNLSLIPNRFRKILELVTVQDISKKVTTNASQLSFPQAKCVGNPSENKERFRTIWNDRLAVVCAFTNDCPNKI